MSTCAEGALHRCPMKSTAGRNVHDAAHSNASVPVCHMLSPNQINRLTAIRAIHRRVETYTTMTGRARTHSITLAMYSSLRSGARFCANGDFIFYYSHCAPDKMRSKCRQDTIAKGNKFARREHARVVRYSAIIATGQRPSKPLTHLKVRRHGVA